MSRKRAGKGDKAKFRRTAVKVKKININPYIPRGGISL